MGAGKRERCIANCWKCVCRETPAHLHSSFLFLWHSPPPPLRHDCVKRNCEDDSGNNRLITLAGLQPMRDRKEWQGSRAQGGGEALLLLLLLLCVFKLQSAPSEGRSASDHCVGAQGSRSVFLRWMWISDDGYYSRTWDARSSAKGLRTASSWDSTGSLSRRISICCHSQVRGQLRSLQIWLN